MNRLVTRLLATFGLAPARSAAEDALPPGGHADVRGAQSWKARAAEALDRAKSLEDELKRQTRLNERLKATTDKLEQRNTQIEALQAKLAHAERELALAREHLMAIEVKLDILEGAANVLDARTRAAVRQQPSETGAPV